MHQQPSENVELNWLVLSVFPQIQHKHCWYLIRVQYCFDFTKQALQKNVLGVYHFSFVARSARDQSNKIPCDFSLWWYRFKALL